MNSEGDHPTSSILVMTDTEDDDGTMWRAVVLYSDGCLAIQGFDTGPGVQRAFGTDEYEFARDLSSTEVARFRSLLGIGEGDDLLGAIRERFGTTAELDEYLSDNGMPGSFGEWKR